MIWSKGRSVWVLCRTWTVSYHVIFIWSAVWILAVTSSRNKRCTFNTWENFKLVMLTCVDIFVRLFPLLAVMSPFRPPCHVQVLHRVAPQTRNTLKQSGKELSVSWCFWFAAGFVPVRLSNNEVSLTVDLPQTDQAGQLLSLLKQAIAGKISRFAGCVVSWTSTTLHPLAVGCFDEKKWHYIHSCLCSQEHCGFSSVAELWVRTAVVFRLDGEVPIRLHCAQSIHWRHFWPIQNSGLSCQKLRR